VNALGGLQLVLLAGLGFALLAGLAVSALTPAAVTHVEGWAPERRHRALFLLALSPLLLGLVGLFAALLPSVLALRWPAHDHCLAHNGHVHLCFLHPPAHAGNHASWVVLALALGWAAARAAGALVALLRAARVAAKCLDLRYDDALLGARVLPTSAPLCMLVGLVRPAVVVSEGLLARVSAAELAVMLHHERAHAVRRDTLLRLLAYGATVSMWRPARARLLRALTLSAEQSCDEAAGRAIGDRLQVAEVILEVERLLEPPPVALSGVAASFGGDVSARVEALLEPPLPPGTLARPLTLLLLAVLGLIAASEPLHHLTESLLGALTR
jgi:Zn-dependent protease with chaperone function